MVNQALVRQYLPGEDAVGRELDRGTIIGVVRDVRQVGLDRPAAPEIYYAAAQNLTMVTDLGMTLVVSATGAPESLTSAIRSAVRDVNPNVAIFQVKTMKQVVADSLWQLNLYRWLIGLFAALALGLAGLGLYGVIAYSTAARTREFAIRVALGSGQRAVSRLVLVRGLSLTAIGLGFGVSCAFVAWKLTSSLDALSISSGPDFVSFGVTAGLVLAIALLACAVPAARAARVDPAVALRQA
jgi:ABC-type antimicrobial peptide transport system permease subunit